MPRKTIAIERIATITDFGQSMEIIIPTPKAAKYKPILLERHLFLLIKTPPQPFITVYGGFRKMLQLPLFYIFNFIVKSNIAFMS